MTNWNQIVFVTKLLLVKDSCNMGANNTITTASSSSSGAPRRPTSFLTRNTCLMSTDEVHAVSSQYPVEPLYSRTDTIGRSCLPFIESCP